MKKFSVCIVLFSVFVSSVLSGCGIKQMSEEKKSDIDYTVVTKEDMPETLKNAIEERKKKPFKLSYADKNELYLVAGYGEQISGGFNVVVKDLYITDNTIVFETTLEGPGDAENVSGEVSYPYITVKMEYIDYEVVFK